MAEVKQVVRASKLTRRQAKKARKGYFHPTEHPELKELVMTAEQKAQKDGFELVERKALGFGKVPFPKFVLCAAPSMIETAKAMLRNQKTEYAFRLAQAASNGSISSNVTALATQFSPLSAAEWSGVIDALFDEYRVDKVEVYYTPLLGSGSTAHYSQGHYAVGSDHTNATVPTSLVQVMNYADAKLVQCHAQSASGYFLYQSFMHVHTTHMPKMVVSAGTLASIEWLGVAEAWPGAQLFFASTTGTDAVVTVTRVPVYYVRCRMRR